MNKVNKQTLPNKSKLRQRQAEVTANLIVTAAKSLFLDRGYANTTIEAIAANAEVAVSTVYAVFGSKRGILRAIRAAWHEQSHIREVTYGDHGSASAEERIEKLVIGTCSQWETGAEVVAIYNGAATSDPEAASELSLALAGRRKGMENFAQGLAKFLRAGLDVTHTADILQALCSPELFNELVLRSGWSMDDYQTWLNRTLKFELLGQSEYPAADKKK